MNDPRILVGDCREQLATLADSSIDTPVIPQGDTTTTTADPTLFDGNPA